MEKAWNKYKETLQESTYMQRLTLKQRKEDFDYIFDGLTLDVEY